MIVIESDHYPPMSGSNLICTVTVALETGMVPMIETVTRLCVDTPAGLVRAAAVCADGQCRRVSFRNVPAFLMHLYAMGVVQIGRAACRDRVCTYEIILVGSDS